MTNYKFVDIYSGNSHELEKWKSQGYVGIIYKAGQAGWIDVPVAHPDWRAKAEAAGFMVGYYWVVDSRVSAAEQITAANFALDILGDWGKLGLWADVEYPRWDMTDAEYNATPYKGYDNIKEFIEGIEVAGVYTSPNYWNKMFEGNVPNLPLWTAQFYYSYVEGVSQPDIYGGWEPTLWQYTSEINKIEGNDDVSLWMKTPSEFLEQYGTIMLRKIRKYNSDIYIVTIPKSEIARSLVTRWNPKTVSQVQAETGASLVINGGDYDGDSAEGLAVSLGAPYSEGQDYQPVLDISESNIPSVHDWKYSWNNYFNAIGGKRYLVFNSEKWPAPSASWRERHPRTLVGIGPNGELIIIIVDGRTEQSAGVDLHEAAELGLALRVVHIIDWDGGGSTALNIGGVIINVPIDNGIIGKERAVGNHLAIWLNTVGVLTQPPAPDPDPDPTTDPTPDSGENIMYNCEVIYPKGARMRSGPFAGDNALGPNLEVGTKFEGVEIVSDATDLNNADKKWMRIGIDQYVAVWYPNSAGEPRQRCTYFTQTTTGDPPPEPATSDLPISITFGDDISYVKQTVEVLLKAVK